MFERLKEKLRKRREPLSDADLAEQEAIRREAEQARLRDEARSAEERAPLDGYSRGNSLGGF